MSKYKLKGLSTAIRFIENVSWHTKDIIQNGLQLRKVVMKFGSIMHIHTHALMDRVKAY